MVAKAWKRVIIFSLSSGLVTATMGLSFMLYLIVAAQDNIEDVCTVTEVGQGLLPYGDEGGCDPRWLIWGIAFLAYGALGAVPVALFGSVLVLAAAHGARYDKK
jgi:hypothetical protein